MSDKNNPIAIVKQMFAAFVDGNIVSLLENVHPESLWIYYGANPRLSKAEFKGRPEVRKFFPRLSLTI